MFYICFCVADWWFYLASCRNYMVITTYLSCTTQSHVDFLNPNVHHLVNHNTTYKNFQKE